MLPHQFQPALYRQLLDEKVGRVLPQFKRISAPEPVIFQSPIDGFRMRAEFRIWHDGKALDYVMFDRAAPKSPVVIDEFPIAHKSIQGIMPKLKQCLVSTSELRNRLFQVEFLASSQGQLLVTLIYHRPLGELWHTEATKLSDTLSVSVIGRSRGQKMVVGDDFITENVEVHGETYLFKQPEQAFTQPNATINAAMLGWALDTENPNRKDLLELYCGVGNFTIPLSSAFDTVLATEVSKVASRAAIDNLESNRVRNVEFARLSAEEVGVAMRGEREFRRLKGLSKPLESYDFSTVFVDPPRAGLDDETVSLVKNFNEILYISCNPMTLIDNLQVMMETHEVAKFAIFDQFPYTEHLECGVQLLRRPAI